MSDFTEVLRAKSQQRRAVDLGIAADVVLNPWNKRSAVFVVPGLFGPVSRLDKNSARIPVLLLARQVATPFEQQNSFARRGQMVSKRSSARSGPNDNDVVMRFRSHMILSKHRR